MMNLRTVLGLTVALTAIPTALLAPSPVRAENATRYPAVATVSQLTMGDLMCYAELVDEAGVKSSVGANFEICENEARFLNKKVALTYGNVRVNDCQSAEPCGKTRVQRLITGIELADASESDVQVLSNGKWRLEIGGGDSWSGVNGMGNLSYRGCDRQGNCLSLTGGKVTCRNGLCAISWQNGEYSYTVETPISEEGNSPSTLIVRRGNRLILRETGFR